MKKHPHRDFIDLATRDMSLSIQTRTSAEEEWSNCTLADVITAYTNKQRNS